MDLLSDLTDAQRQAVTTTEGPLLVIAGPGSGKTRVITRRVAWIIAEREVRPRDILAITFTNKAASEMRSRLESLLDLDRGRPFCSTFHSFCATFLRRHIERLDGFGRDFAIYDRSDTHGAIREAMDELNIDSQQWRPAAFGEAIGSWKDRFVCPEEARSEAVGDYYATRAAEVYRYYQELLRQRNALDFDDLLGHMVRLLREHEDVRETLQYRFRYILIDEYQDTNHAQYLLAKHLTGEERNICVTGDPDQSIYGWRGADIGNILRFEEDYPSCAVVKLERNYRSTKTILAAADALIKHNALRKEKDLYTENDEGNPVELCLFEDELAEARAIASRAADLVAMGTAPSEIAIFYRVNSLSRPIEQALWEERIPYVVVGALEFYGRKEVKDLLAYLRVLGNARDDTSVLRVLNTPARGIGKVTVDRLRAFARERGLSLLDAMEQAEWASPAGSEPPPIPGLNRRAIGALGRFRRLIDELAELKEGPVAHLLAEIIRRVDYEDYLARTYPDDEDRLENIRALVVAGQQYDEKAAELAGQEGLDLERLAEDEEFGPDAPTLIRGGFAGFLEYTTLLSEQDALDGSDRVQLMTLHTAKGLEFDQVFIAGLEEGTIPHSRSRESDAELEEERRLLFVGMTRARKGLCMSLTRWRNRFGETERRLPSPFLAEVPEALTKRLGLWKLIAPGSGARQPITSKLPPEEEDELSFPFGENEPESQLPPDEAEREAPAAALAPAALDAPKVGERVYHNFFGAGVVKELTGRGAAQRVTVRFDTHGEKKLVLQYANLARSRR